MNQIELVIANLIDRIAQTEKENAILKAELMLANEKINEKIREMEEKENGD